MGSIGGYVFTTHAIMSIILQMHVVVSARSVLNISRPLTLKNLWNNSCNQFIQAFIIDEKCSRCAQ